ncbi:LPXTG cell wall anchor domain-containing protein [Vagococcus xieshaowenii]|uniref:LPXTG cell wall anchor domain-containing protein n=1 Tax=Vagococcus xieshaowenii TaxID=2562451 RepID=A0AAJ5EEI9_9ENTE|nr:LPXTG cell wall anchor domain-containing protein [Vagococcus xieshaowenii]QCA29433.1 LPXTG cell wall anchor domain-containing protein [Vagococcus xieshaowenii]TFZ41553.1 LPXTG cell wall anchor domain-containing protein [Vagococcus xieshaowenii]
MKHKRKEIFIASLVMLVGLYVAFPVATYGAVQSETPVTVTIEKNNALEKSTGKDTTSNQPSYSNGSGTGLLPQTNEKTSSMLITFTGVLVTAISMVVLVTKKMKGVKK